ncbi:hypothetical protein [Halobacillus sp. K22]|uniref:hypothetical protein n=1 Tax=Halobacillus sp. K22 TaxID=3457431 RepID=UPI003FCCBD67
MENFDDNYRKDQEDISHSNDIDLNSLLKLYSTLSTEGTLFDKLAGINVSNDSIEFDLSSILKVISQSTSPSYSGIENELNDIKKELKRLNKNLKTLNKKC